MKADILDPSSGFMVPLRRGQSLDMANVSMLLRCLICDHSREVERKEKLNREGMKGWEVLKC